VTGICTAGDVRLLPLLIRAERDRASLSPEGIDATLSSLPEYASLFTRAEGREIPDWLEPLLEEGHAR
jgi:hypothetical protein